MLQAILPRALGAPSLSFWGLLRTHDGTLHARLTSRDASGNRPRVERLGVDHLEGVVEALVGVDRDGAVRAESRLIDARATGKPRAAVRLVSATATLVEGRAGSGERGGERLRAHTHRSTWRGSHPRHRTRYCGRVRCPSPRRQLRRERLVGSEVGIKISHPQHAASRLTVEPHIFALGTNALVSATNHIA